MEYKLSNFEGPLDLLLHLINKAKIQPKDIFVSEITEQYLRFVESSGDLDMDSASEFLQMAATLIYIKSRSLLPEKRRPEDLDESGLSPEEKLLLRLNEYKRFKDVSELLKELQKEAAADIYKLPEELVSEDTEPVFINAEADALSEAFLRILKRLERKNRVLPEPTKVIVYSDSFSIKTQMRMIIDTLSINKRVRFDSLFENQSCREEIAVTFLALLELLNMGKLNVKQERTFGEIDIILKEQTNV